METPLYLTRCKKVRYLGAGECPWAAKQSNYFITHLSLI